MKKVYKTLSILILVGILLPDFVLGQEKFEFEKIIFEFIKNLFKTILEIFKRDVLTFWKKIWSWFLENIGKKILEWARSQPKEKLKERLQKGMEQEKEELKKENFLEKFLDWLKNKITK